MLLVAVLIAGRSAEPAAVDKAHNLGGHDSGEVYSNGSGYLMRRTSSFAYNVASAGGDTFLFPWRQHHRETTRQLGKN